MLSRLEHVSELYESPESPSNLLVHDIPTADSLLLRLQPKLVSDPFLNYNGDTILLDDILK